MASAQDATQLGNGNGATHDPSGLQQVIAVLAGAVPGLIARSQSGGSNVPPELRQLLQQSVNRTEYQNPLFQAATNQAFQGLPTYARQGMSLGSLGATAPPSDPAADPNGFDWKKALLAAGAGAAGGALAGGKLPIGAIAEWLKKLFGHHGSDGTVQGDKPNAGGTGLPIGNPGLPGFFGWDPSGPDAPDPGLLLSDPGVWYGPTGSGAYPTDPSGGTGVGPGMADFYGNNPDEGYF